MEYTLKQGPDFIELLLVAEGSVEELEAAFLEAVALARANSMLGILVDARLSRVHPSFDQIRHLADFISALRPFPPPRTALIVSSGLQFGIARMFGALVEFLPWEFVICRNEDEARNCLLKKPVAID